MSRTGFTGHLCGAIAGLLVGVFVLENRRVRAWEKIVGVIRSVYYEEYKMCYWQVKFV